jgi:lipooligosaccharide transport system ATP-binding protein
LLENPATMDEAALWTAMATGPIEADAIKARSEMWGAGERSIKLGAVICFLIFLTVPSIYLFETFLPLLIGGPLIVIAAVYGAVRAIGPGGEIDSSYDRLDGATKPLGLQVTARPKGGFRPAPRPCPASTSACGVTELSGERYGKQVIALRRPRRRWSQRGRAHRPLSRVRGEVAADRGAQRPRRPAHLAAQGEAGRLALRPLAGRAARLRLTSENKRFGHATIRSMAAIELRDVVKTFGPITAVDGLDLEVPEGICLGLLGPNGAGKSTTMRLLTGQAVADSGTLRVLGYELPKQSKPARAEMGVVPQLDNLDVDVTVEDNLAVYARLYRVPDVGAAVDRCLDLARLRDAVDKLSGGMRRRLLLARGLVHEPRLVLLDEPTVGLDPQIRTELWTLIGDLKSRGTTILMSTHYIEEAERLSDEVAVMHRGKIISRGAPADLISQHAGRETAEVYAPPQRLTELRTSAEAAGLRVRPAGPAIAIVGSEQANHGAVPEDAVIRAATLEDVFVLLTGEEAE